MNILGLGLDMTSYGCSDCFFFGSSLVWFLSVLFCFQSLYCSYTKMCVCDITVMTALEGKNGSVKYHCRFLFAVFRPCVCLPLLDASCSLTSLALSPMSAISIKIDLG